MRILRVADVPNDRLGGMSRTMHHTGDELIALGHRVDYLFSEQLPLKAPPRLRRFLVPLLLPSISGSLAASGQSYDVIEIHEPLAWYYSWLRKRKPSRPPAVIFSYGLEERGRQAELAYRKRKGLPTTVKSQLLSKVLARLAGYGVRHAGHVIVSNTGDRHYLQRAGVAAERITVHQSAAREDFLEAGKGLVASGAERDGVLFLGSWLTRKGILDLVPALSSVMLHHPELRFTAAGTGCEPSRVLSAFPEPLHNRIAVVPKLSNDAEVIATLSRHAIFVLPSYFEGSPLALVEAAALGLAIVTTDISGMSDLIHSGVNGHLVPVGDAAALEQQLASLVADPVTSRRLGKAALESASSLSWAQAAARIAGAYEHAVGDVSVPKL